VNETTACYMLTSDVITDSCRSKPCCAFTTKFL